MTTVARHVASTPKRTTTETWTVIIDLLAPEAGAARDELARAAGAVSMLIADEVTKDRALVIGGTGPQVRIYTVHGEDAIDGAGVNETPLSTNPTASTWTLSVPVPEEDAEWIAGQLAGLPHVTVAELVNDTTVASSRSSVPVIDLNELRS